MGLGAPFRAGIDWLYGIEISKFRARADTCTVCMIYSTVLYRVRAEIPYRCEVETGVEIKPGSGIWATYSSDHGRCKMA